MFDPSLKNLQCSRTAYYYQTLEHCFSMWTPPGSRLLRGQKETKSKSLVLRLIRRVRAVYEVATFQVAFFFSRGAMAKNKFKNLCYSLECMAALEEKLIAVLTAVSTVSSPSHSLSNASGSSAAAPAPVSSTSAICNKQIFQTIAQVLFATYFLYRFNFLINIFFLKVN